MSQQTSAEVMKKIKQSSMTSPARAGKGCWSTAQTRTLIGIPNVRVAPRTLVGL